MHENITIYCDISANTIRPYVPAPLRKRVFSSLHQLAHPGGKTTCKLIRQRYVWPNMRKEILVWSRNCIKCQQAKIQKHTKNLPIQIKVPDERFGHVHMDIIILPCDQGYRYCLTMMDRATRWPEAVPLKNITAENVALAFYNNWVVGFGTPRTVTTDQGSQFESELFQALTKLLGIERCRTTPYHPASNGLIERWHRTLKAALMCQVDKSWISCLPTVLLGLRTCIKTDTNISAAEMLYGATLKIPGEFFTTSDTNNKINYLSQTNIVDRIRENIRTFGTHHTKHHIKSRVFRHKELDKSSHVFLRIDSVKKTLEKPYSGPHEIVKRITENTIEIKVNGKNIVVSTERVKPAFLENKEQQQATQQATQRTTQQTTYDSKKPQSTEKTNMADQNREDNLLQHLFMKNISTHKKTKKVTFDKHVYWEGGDVANVRSNLEDQMEHRKNKRKQKLVPLNWD